MSIKYDGSGLKKLTENVEKLKETNEISFSEILNDEFMQRNTPFKSLNELFEKSGFKHSTEEEIADIPDDLFNEFISANTQYETFQDLQVSAMAEFVSNQLLKGLK